MTTLNSVLTRNKAPTLLAWRVAPHASVIIVNYNSGAKLSACLASILETVGPECEVVVVDNASGDGSADVMERDFPQVTLIRSRTNVGFGGGNNIGASWAKGEYLIFLNPDTVAEAGWLEAMLAPFENDLQIGLVTSKIVLTDQPDRINTCGNAIHLTGLTLCRGLGLPRETFDKSEAVNAVSGAAFAIRRETFAALGGFDEDFFLYMEDTDLSWRARLAGWRNWYTPDSVIRHSYTLKITPLKVFFQERNRYLMLLKNLRWPTLFALLPALLLAEVITWGFVLLADRRNIKNKLLAYQWLGANWQHILRKRQTTQKLRKVSDRAILRQAGFTIDFAQAAKGPVALVAKLTFGPLFALLKAATLAVVWW
ncbi:MAG: glycosyltransferase family 2 protein [Chloroflexi bacterium]|nr:glycosyltransferase family 2 protein [Chloroflexota bacterium]